VNKLARPFVVFVERFYPDPFVFAIGLTVIVFFMALGLTDAGPSDAVVAWGDGLAGLMTFIGQLALTIVTAHALAHTDPVRRGLGALGRIPKSPAMAYGMVAFIAGVASLFAWAFGLVVGALIARQVAMEARKNGLKLHYPLLVASAYAGFVIWHMGYSGSAPLFVATPGHALEEQVGGIIPVSETIFAPWNIATALVALIAITALMAAMKPKEGRDEIIEISDAAIEDYQQTLAKMDRELAVSSMSRSGGSAGGAGAAVRSSRSSDMVAGSETGASQRTAVGGGQEDAAEVEKQTLADRLDKTRILSLFIGLALAVYLAMYFADNGLNLTLDVVNWTFLALGLLLARSVLHYVKLVAHASTAVGQIILQYPFYAGIMGMMAGTGLISVFADWFTSISTAGTLGFWAFLSGGILNMFVPSGGGQWAIQGPIFIEAAQNLGTDPSRVVMGVAYGDQWTNMIQPFFTIPLLAIAGLHVRQIMGYTFLVLIVTGFIFGGGILLAGSGA
jgi:short-chain fatty acids transporter